MEVTALADSYPHASETADPEFWDRALPVLTRRLQAPLKTRGPITGGFFACCRWKPAPARWSADSLVPLLDSRGRWRFYLGVDSPGWYFTAARMAIALGEGGVPFEFHRRDEVAAALRGRDFIPVGPRFGRSSLAELRTSGRKPMPIFAGTPSPRSRPISEDQQRRLEYVLRTGSPAEWK